MSSVFIGYVVLEILRNILRNIFRSHLSKMFELFKLDKQLYLENYTKNKDDYMQKLKFWDPAWESNG